MSRFLLALIIASLTALPAPAQEVGGPEADALNAAVAALVQGDHAAAESQFRAILDRAPQTAEAWLGLSEARRLQGDLDEALEAAQRAGEAAPGLAAAPLTAARVHMDRGAAQPALSELEDVLELDPDSVDALMLISLVLRQLGRIDEAAAGLANAWNRGVRHPAVAEQLSIVRLTQGDPAAALRLAEEGLTLAPGRPTLLLSKGLAKAALTEHRAEAVVPLGEAIHSGLLPEPGRVHLEIGAILVEEGRFAEAIGHLETARDEVGHEPAVHYQLATARRALGQAEEALADLARFEELAGESDADDATRKALGTRLNEAQALAAAERLDEALEAVRALLLQNPDDAPALALEAKILFSLGHRTEAEVSLARARELLPTHAEYHFLAGLFRMYAGLPVEAEKALRRALTLDGSLAEAHALLGGSLAKQGKSEEAIVHFQRALELGIDQPDVRLGYAGALEELGRQSEADEQMKAYRRLTATN
ncbi:MAG: tetratricopeptide repeat protein [Acidobacteriota bacterium]|nr:tetratricopeptide repeat protein [Acidobacteriota bacterium]